jgi:hypothetical protein
VRLHRLDENSASSVSGLLSNLTELQQDHDLAIILVHHTTKHRGKNPSGQDFRGSSDFYAWGGSNIVTQKGGKEGSSSPLSTGLHRQGRSGLCGPLKVNTLASKWWTVTLRTRQAKVEKRTTNE